MTVITDFADRPLNRMNLESLLRKRFFFTESFEAYRTASGFKATIVAFFDYGPPGCALISNLVEI